MTTHEYLMTVFHCDMQGRIAVVRSVLWLRYGPIDAAHAVAVDMPDRASAAALVVVTVTGVASR